MLNLRPAAPADAPLILQYIRDLAEYEREPEAAVATEADILKHAFSEHPLVKVTLAEWDGQPAGFALWFLNFSTWEGQPGHLPGGPLRPPGLPGQGHREGPAAASRGAGRAGGLDALRVAGAGLEHAGHRVLRGPWREGPAPLAHLPGRRRGAQTAGRGAGLTWGPLLRLKEFLGPDAELMVVGGAVRDELLGRPHADWDLATRLLPQTVMHRARAAGLRVIPTGLQHGTVTVLLEDRPVEVTTFRGDGSYLDGRRPESVRLGVDLAEDLARRDFTINAMALPVGGGGLVDPFGGQRDLAARLIRAVGDPLQRFAEDGLRPLRACRFASQLGFEVESATLAAIPLRLEVARKVAVERVFTELDKLLGGGEPHRGLALLAESGLMDLWLTELRPMIGCGQNRHHRHDVWTHTLEVLREVPAESGLRWAALLHDAGKPGTRTTGPDGEVHFYGHEARSLDLAEAILERLKASHALRQDVAALIRHHGTHPTDAWSDAACRRFLGRLAGDSLSLDRWATFRLADQRGKGLDLDDRLSEHRDLVSRLEALAAAAPPLAVRDLALDGAALMKLAGRSGGPWLGELQRQLLVAVMDDPGLNRADALAELAGRLISHR